MSGQYSAQETARILHLSPVRLRACLRAADMPATRNARYGFEQLVVLKTARSLLDARIPSTRVRRILTSLQRQLPHGKNLSSVTIHADGRRVVVWDGTARWQPDSGQFLFNFTTEAIVPRSVTLPRPRHSASASARLTAEDWFALGMELESASPQEAREAYRQALRLAPEHAAAWINLGRLAHCAGDLPEAERCYREAVAQAPDDALGWFNLGVVLEDRHEWEAAIVAYQGTLTCDSRFRDAHHNLALLFERLGKRTDAIRHLQAVRDLDRPRRRHTHTPARGRSKPA